jgi:hypothetical protein
MLTVNVAGLPEQHPLSIVALSLQTVPPGVQSSPHKCKDHTATDAGALLHAMYCSVHSTSTSVDPIQC